MEKKQPNSIDVYVGSRIRLRRVMLGLSQEKLGDALGVTFQQVQKYEKGVNRVGASRLQATADVLSVPISFFFAEDDGIAALQSGKRDMDDVSAFILTKEGLDLNRAFVTITDSSVRQSIVKLAKSLASLEGSKDAADPSM